MPDVLQSASGLVVLAILVGLFWLTFRKRSRGGALAAAPKPAFTCEWVSRSLARSKADFRERFPELDRVAAGHAPERIQLIRFGIFNESEDAFEASAMSVPVALQFAEGDSVLSVVCTEQEKAEAGLPETIAGPGTPGSETAANDRTAALPPFRMAGRSSIILNLIILGEGRITGAAGRVDDLGDLRRIR